MNLVALSICFLRRYFCLGDFICDRKEEGKKEREREKKREKKRKEGVTFAFENGTD